MKELPRKIQKTLESIKKENPVYVEIKVINGNYYVYKSTSEWDKQNKKTKKNTDYLGRITLDGEFIKKKTKDFIQGSDREIFEYGNGALAYQMIKDVEDILKNLTPYYKELIAAAIIKVIDPKPIRLLSSRWEKLYLSKQNDINLSAKQLSAVLYATGQELSWWYTLFSKLTCNGELILYDLTSIFTYSKNIKLAEKGYNSDHTYLDQIGVIMAFSTSNSLPIGVDIFYGSLKDITTIKDFIQRMPKRDFGFIMDRGFTSYKLLVELNRIHIHYIVPLRKNSELLDLRDIRWKGTFLYRDRPVRWSRKFSRYGLLYIFEDPILKGEEEAALLRRVEKKEISMEEYEKERNVAGIIGLISDLNRNGEAIFLDYKGREDVELAFDVMKNAIDSDKTYMQTPEGVRGYYFISFLAMRIYFKILKRLRERNLTNKISVEEVLFELSKVEKVVEKKGREYFAKVPKKAREMTSLFSDILPPMG